MRDDIDSVQVADDQYPNRGIGQAFLVFAIAGVMFIFGAIAQSISLPAGLVFTLVVCVLGTAIVYVKFWCKLPVLEGLGIRNVPALTWLLSILIGAGGWSLAVSLYFMQEPILGEPIGQGLSSNSFGEYLGLLFIAAVLPGICEESLFRGVIMGILRRKGNWFAIVVAGLLFGAFHIDPWRIFPAAVLGMLFGWLTIRTGSLLPAILAHIANNATAISVGYFLPGDDPPKWILMTLAGIFFIAIAGLIFLTTDRSSEMPPLARVPAALPKFAAWIVGILGVLSASMMAFAYAAFFTFLHVMVMPDDSLAPEIDQGATLLLMKSQDPAQVAAADTIGIQQDGQATARVVSRVEDNRVWVKDGEQEMEVPTDQIIGKLMQTIPSGAEGGESSFR